MTDRRHDSTGERFLGTAIVSATPAAAGAPSPAPCAPAITRNSYDCATGGEFQVASPTECPAPLMWLEMSTNGGPFADLNCTQTDLYGLQFPENVVDTYVVRLSWVTDCTTKTVIQSFTSVTMGGCPLPPGASPDAGATAPQITTGAATATGSSSPSAPPRRPCCREGQSLDGLEHPRWRRVDPRDRSRPNARPRPAFSLVSTASGTAWTTWRLPDAGGQHPAIVAPRRAHPFQRCLVDLPDSAGEQYQSAPSLSASIQPARDRSRLRRRARWPTSRSRRPSPANARRALRCG